MKKFVVLAVLMLALVVVACKKEEAPVVSEPVTVVETITADNDTVNNATTEEIADNSSSMPSAK